MQTDSESSFICNFCKKIHLTASLEWTGSNGTMLCNNCCTATEDGFTTTPSGHGAFLKSHEKGSTLKPWNRTHKMTAARTGDHTYDIRLLA